MPGSPTLFDLFLRLGSDDLLLGTLTHIGLEPPSDAGTLTPIQRALQLAVAVDAAPNPVRERIQSQFHRIGLLADDAGLRYMRNACHGHPEALHGLTHLPSNPQRALWLSRHHTDLFEAAEEVCWADRHPCTCVQQRAIGIQRPIDRSDEARARFTDAISAFLGDTDHRGQTCHCVIVDRHVERSVQVTVYLHDPAKPEAALVADTLPPHHTAFSVRHMAIVYSPSQGVIRTLVNAGAAYHEALVSLFSRHLLHCETDLQRCRPTGIDMNRLRRPLPLHDDVLLESVHLHEVVLLDEMTGGEITIKTNGCSQIEQDVHAMLAEWMPSNNPFQMPRFRLAAATLNISTFDAPGSEHRRTVTLALKCQGGNNLEDFEIRTRRQLESWMVGWKLIPEDHALTAQTARVASDVPALA